MWFWASIISELSPLTCWDLGRSMKRHLPWWLAARAPGVDNSHSSGGNRCCHAGDNCAGSYCCRGTPTSRAMTFILFVLDTLPLTLSLSHTHAHRYIIKNFFCSLFDILKFPTPCSPFNYLSWFLRLTSLSMYRVVASVFCCARRTVPPKLI